MSVLTPGLSCRETANYLHICKFEPFLPLGCTFSGHIRQVITDSSLSYVRYKDFNLLLLHQFIKKTKQVGLLHLEVPNSCLPGSY